MVSKPNQARPAAAAGRGGGGGGGGGCLLLTGWIAVKSSRCILVQYNLRALQEGDLELGPGHLE